MELLGLSSKKSTIEKISASGKISTNSFNTFSAPAFATSQS